MAFRDSAYHIVLDSADLYVEVAGEEEGTPILYLHGGPGYNSFSFRDLLGDSLEQYLMIYADQRGGGRSYADGPFAFDVLAEDVREILRNLKLDRVVLLAHGFGAAVAVKAAATWPELFERLILVGPWLSMPVLARTVHRTAAVLSGNDSLAVPPEADLQEGEADDPALLTDQAFAWQPAKRIFDELQFPNPASRLHLEHSDSSALAGPTAPADVLDPWQVNVLPLLGQLKSRVIIITGQHDLTAMPAQVEAALLELPEALFSMTAGGHYPWLDDPETFLSLLEQALAA